MCARAGVFVRLTAYAEGMPQLPIVLKPARADRIDAEHLPVIPAWWPLPDARELIDRDTGTPTGATPDQVRRGRALLEASQGPHDGERMTVTFRDGAAPPPEVVLADGLVVYRIDHVDSNKRVLTYRYSPADSQIHAGAMRAVEEAFAEYGSQYALEAREDDTSALGYADRHPGPPDGGD